MRILLGAAAAAAILALGAALPASAATITPVSYTFDQAADCGTWCYYDSGSELTDGVLGVAYWGANSGIEWDGWTDAQVNIDFTFSTPHKFDSVSVGSTQDNTGDVVLPNISIFSSLDGLSWNPEGSLNTPISSANNATSTYGPHVFLTVANLNFTAPYVRVQLNSNCCFMFVDEVRFAAGAVPEPATWAMMLTGFFGLGSVLRRRRSGLAA